MAIKIGHASADERGKANSGKAGDQTGGEVCIRTWYSSPWDAVLRPKKAAQAEKMAKAMEAACANKNIGYDQYQRNDLYTQAKKVNWDLAKITTPCETDCSALVTVCAQCAGIDVAYISGNAPYTGIMKAQFLKTGAFELLTERKYLTSDAYLMRGDILLRTSGHTAMALENGAQSGKKTSSSNKITTSAGGEKVTVTLNTLRKGSTGENVKALQILLNGRGHNCGTADGEFGSLTHIAVTEFQKKSGLTVDGIVGGNTWRCLLK